MIFGNSASLSQPRTPFIKKVNGYKLRGRDKTTETHTQAPVETDHSPLTFPTEKTCLRTSSHVSNGTRGDTTVKVHLRRVHWNQGLTSSVSHVYVGWVSSVRLPYFLVDNDNIQWLWDPNTKDVGPTGWPRLGNSVIWSYGRKYNKDINLHFFFCQL